MTRSVEQWLSTVGQSHSIGVLSRREVEGDVYKERQSRCKRGGGVVRIIDRTVWSFPIIYDFPIRCTHWLFILPL